MPLHRMPEKSARRVPVDDGEQRAQRFAHTPPVDGGQGRKASEIAGAVAFLTFSGLTIIVGTAVVMTAMASDLRTMFVAGACSLIAFAAGRSK